MCRKNGFFAFLLIALPLRADVLVTQGQHFGVDVSARHGRIAMDLLGSIWVMTADGGEAARITDGMLLARRPRWSPDGSQILYELSGSAGLRLLNIADREARSTSSGSFVDRDASWHPDGERILFSSRRAATGLDLWETDLPTGLSWRISNLPGDETEAVWSTNGKHLAFIHHHEDEYSLMLRRHGESDVTLFRSAEPISSLSWRPDGSLLSFLHGADGGASFYIAILSVPAIVRPLLTGEAFHVAPVSWRDRGRFYFTAGGEIRMRDFDAHLSSALPFRAMVDEPEPPPERVIARRELDIVNPPEHRLVIRARRLFDGIWPGYREHMDVMIDGGRIAAISARQDWSDATLLDLGNVTVLPGYVDAWSDLPSMDQDNTGTRVLAYGVTTIVTDQLRPEFDPSVWEGEEYPGPRVLPVGDVAEAIAPNEALPYYLVFADSSDSMDGVRRWQERGVLVLADGIRNGVRVGADLVSGMVTAPGIFSELPSMSGRTLRGMTVVSGMATGRTPGLPELLNSRQSLAFGQNHSLTVLAPSAAPGLPLRSRAIVAGSRVNRLPAGLGLHAELRALSAAGLSNEKVLHAAGREAALVLGLENQLGQITPGAAADLVIVSGDPLRNIEDTIRIAAVVRNGRLYSLVSLLERGK